jgi:hypothetical protein
MQFSTLLSPFPTFFLSPKNKYSCVESVETEGEEKHENIPQRG